MTTPTSGTASNGVGFAAIKDVSICYETFGRASDPAVLLIMGFTAQMTAWDDSFCRQLAERHHYVIRFDNRDCGLSTHLDGVTVPGAVKLIKAAAGVGKAPEVPYTLSTMATDAVGLLDHLKIKSAHIVGASMGGMIAQTVAIEHPARAITMTSIMSHTGESAYSEASPEAMKALMEVPPREREAFIAASVRRTATFASPRYFNAERVAARAAFSYDRAFYPQGAGRQLAAIQASGSRAHALRELTTPTLVIHGRADELIRPKGGERTAELIRGANLMLLNDMGHDLPEPLWPVLIDAMASHFKYGPTLAAS
jgi:pimeloyl-ACP methyl ester carboxylesterase